MRQASSRTAPPVVGGLMLLCLSAVVPVAFAPDWIQWILDALGWHNPSLSHSLLTVAIGATAVAGAYWAVTRSRDDANIVWLTYASHWPADFITAHKAIDLLRHERRLKRGGAPRNVPEQTDPEAALEQVIGREPTPEFALQVAEECQRLLDKLGDAQLRSIALWKMEGHTNDEIAEKLGKALVTVERRLRLIRKFWENEMPS